MGMQRKLQSGTISIIIPTLNEEAHLEKTLTAIGSNPGINILVVDGGSHDRTITTAGRFPVTLVHEKIPGRASQMNSGARIASGEILLFLHADTLLPKNFPNIIRRTLVVPGIAAGAFRLQLDLPSWKARMLEQGIWLRSRFLQLPFGDQAFFVKADLFRQAGGFPEIPLMEDVSLIRSLRRYGRIATVSPPVISSGRRWRQLGFLRTTLINQLILWAHLLGVSPAVLAKWYGIAKK